MSSVPVMRVVERCHALSEVAGKLRQGKARHAKSSWVSSVLACKLANADQFPLVVFFGDVKHQAEICPCLLSTSVSTPAT